MTQMPEQRKIFVFGSNLAGRHGKGAAKYALEHKGAIYGQGKGIQGYSYAIPTKGRSLERLSIAEVSYHVQEFIRFSRLHPEYMFEVTPIGCGLAGNRVEDIAPLFLNVPSNVELPETFKECLSTTHQGRLQRNPP